MIHYEKINNTIKYLFQYLLLAILSLQCMGFYDPIKESREDYYDYVQNHGTNGDNLAIIIIISIIILTFIITFIYEKIKEKEKSTIQILLDSAIATFLIFLFIQWSFFILIWGIYKLYNYIKHKNDSKSEENKNALQRENNDHPINTKK